MKLAGCYIGEPLWPEGLFDPSDPWWQRIGLTQEEGEALEEAVEIYQGLGMDFDVFTLLSFGAPFDVLDTAQDMDDEETLLSWAGA